MHEATPNHLKAIFGQLSTLGVDVHFHEMPIRHRFDDCNYSCHTIDDDAPAACTVYPADGPSDDTCVACTVPAAEAAIVTSGGRSDQVTIDIAVTDVDAARALYRQAAAESFAVTTAAADAVRDLLARRLIGAGR